MNTITNFMNDYKEYKEDVKKSKNKIKMIIPNLLTFSRVLAPFFILPAVLFDSFPLALSFAILFAITDAFDGFLARKWNATTNFGKNLDPICDKFFILGIIIPFLNNPIMILTLILEGAIATINLKSEFKNNKPRSTYLGKGKTVLLSLLISLSYLFKTIGISMNFLFPLAIITNVVQGITAIDYLSIDNKKDRNKKIKQLNSKENENITINDKQNENVLTNKKQQIRKEIIEYKHLKDTLINSNEDEIKIEEGIKKKHFDMNKK